MIILLLLLLGGVYRDTKQILNELGCSPFSSRPFSLACFNVKRRQWLMRNMTFHNQETLRSAFLKDRFARIHWLIKNFENNSRKYYRHTPYTVIDETLINFCAVFSCNFKVYLSEKPGEYGVIFRCLADAEADADNHSLFISSNQTAEPQCLIGKV